MPTHFQKKNREGQCKTYPEPQCHVGEFWIGASAHCYQNRLECHAADRARSRPDLLDLGMHGASVDCPSVHRCRSS